MMSGGAQSPLQALTAAFGQEVIVTDSSQLEAVNIDHRRLYRGRALALALPRDVEQVSRLLALCNALRIPVVPQGGNTGYCGAATPDESGRQLVLSLRRLNAVRHVDPLNASMVVEAGCILADVQRAAATVGRFFPLSLGAEGSCQIGGNLATNAGGVNVVRYGMTRDLVLGLEVVLADGRVLSNLTALRKDNTGYDLRHLFVGSEGTLGVITAASLKLFAPQSTVSTAFVAVPSPAAAVELLDRLRTTSQDAVSSFELVPESAVQLVMRYVANARAPLATQSPWFVLIEWLAGDLASALESALEAGLITDAVLAQNDRERRDFWYLREHIPEGQRRHGASLKHDVSVPIDRLPAFIDEATCRIEALISDTLLVCYGHVGDGNLHFNISARVADADGRGESSAALLACEEPIKRALHDLVADYQGSLSAEHGIGRLKVQELERYASPVELELMRAIKRSFDPNGILNPGKVLRVD